LVQKLKRKDISETNELDELERSKISELQSIRTKYYDSKDESLLKEESDIEIRNIQDAYFEKRTLIENRYTIRKVKFENKMNTQISIRTEKADIIRKQIFALTEKNDDGILKCDELLKLDKLSMHFGGLKAVDELSFTVKKGEIFGLIGPNGAGKTTVFNCITRFYKPTAGEVYFKNHLNETVHINDVVVHNIIKEGIVRTFQNVEMVWELNILENLLVAAHTKYRSGFFGHLFNSRLLRQEEVIMKTKAQKILKDLELLQYSYAYPMGLPYGILKKVELARTLMVEPRLIILDEPAAGLNDSETDALAETIKKIRDEYNTTIFLVEHDMGLVMDICDTVCAISFGKKLAIGSPKEIQNSKVVREAYLGGE